MHTELQQAMVLLRNCAADLENLLLHDIRNRYTLVTALTVYETLRRATSELSSAAAQCKILEAQLERQQREEP